MVHAHIEVLDDRIQVLWVMVVGLLKPMHRNVVLTMVSLATGLESVPNMG